MKTQAKVDVDVSDRRWVERQGLTTVDAGKCGQCDDDAVTF